MEVLLLGNGFDIYHDLPTKYSCFINTVNFLKDNFIENEMNTVGKVFNNKLLYEVDALIKNSYARYYMVYSNFPLNINAVKKLINGAKTNAWFKYLSKIAEKIQTWIDFEKEISTVINTFELFFSNNTKKDIRFDKLSYSEKSIVLAFDFFYDELENTAVVNAPKKIYQIRDEYLSCHNLSNILYIDKHKIINCLYLQLVELSNMLKLYLKCFVEDVLDKVSSQALNNVPQVFSNANHVFTLNYTNTFERFYDKNSKKKVYHVHGNVEGDIVLGLNSNKFDELEELNTDFICFKKYYQRVYYKTDLEYLEAIYDNGIFDDRVKTNLSVFGHSLDVTDREIITALFERVQKITIYCHTREVAGDYIKNWFLYLAKKNSSC